MKELKVIFKGHFFSIRYLRTYDVNNDYINALKNQMFILNNKNISLADQRKYVKNLYKDKNKTILGVFNKKNLIATSGFQNLNKNVVSIGFFLFGKKFLKKGFGHYFISIAASFILNEFKKKKFKCGINNKNVISIKAFEKAGFKKIKKKSISDKKFNSSTYILVI